MTSVPHSIQNPNPQNTINLRKRRKISENEKVDSTTTNANTDTDDDKHFYCKICTETKAKKERFTITGCNHSFCIDCTVKYVSSKVYQMIQVKIHCPFCMDHFLNVDDCRKILPKEVFDLWGKKLCEAEIPESDKFYCPFKDCSALMIDDGDDGNGRKLRRKFECPHCDRMFCSQCRVAWHHGIRCKEFQNRVGKDKRKKDDEDDVVMKMAKKKRWQRCPNCKFYVEKTAGCKHMNCRCGEIFCYKCGESYKNDDVLVGDIGSGKTSLALRFVKGLFFHNQDTFVKAKKWVEELQMHVTSLNELKLLQDGEQFAHESGMFYIETSANIRENINELFYETAKRLAKAYAPKLIGMKLNNEMQDRRRRFFCCSV
ncbi:hypothetical protein PIB30_017505 [Stylosanthes scabra]|uniref:RBR-type E3 ubiquitin transferase n=1 Tax=Stylosanthes scabra TaxID=79078 RepID=A0ABU6R7W9_9FABA|nr:hypothetical protein [Stylosanthes scabra]